VFDYVARFNYRLPIREYKFNLLSKEEHTALGTTVREWHVPKD